MGSMPLQISGSTHFPPDKIKQRAKIRHSLAPGKRRTRERRVTEESQHRCSVQDLSGVRREHWGTSCCQRQQENKCLSPQEKMMPLPSPPTLMPLGCAWAQGSRSSKMSPASTASPAHPMCSAACLAQKQSQTLLPQPPLLGGSWDFHNH